MFTRRHGLRAVLAVAAVAVIAAACSSNNGSTGNSASKKTLTIWSMPGELPPKMRAALTEEFQNTHRNVKVNYEDQEWSGIQAKTITALGSNTPPDVIEFGNTYTASFADGLVDLSGKASGLGKSSWFTGMADSATVDGKTVAVPYLSGARVVLYRTDMFTQAGISTPPTTLAEFTADAGKLMAKFGANPKFSALYYPGQYWYGALPFIWDAGGDIATQSGGKWTGALDSPQSIQGLTTLKNLVASFSKAPKDKNEVNQFQTLADGTAAMVIDQAFQIPAILKANPKLAPTDIATFPLPGVSGPAPVFAGGSNVGISAASKNQSLALDYVKLMTSPKYEKMMANEAGLLPNTTTLTTLGDSNPTLAVNFAALKNSKFVPSAANWGSVEGKTIIPDMLENIFTGKRSVADAAKKASEEITTELNAN
ncbi:MAG TPA: extracellular solute-binding protein [Mycobacteriales bacterium]|nr:extracellular solute-binding protein [Mycobacteriales bacterium]